MFQVIKNTPVKRITAWLCILWLLILTVGCIFLYSSGKQTMYRFIEHDYEIAGALSQGTPTAELSLLTGTMKQENVERGKQMLAPYGYDKEIPEQLYQYYSELMIRPVLWYVLFVTLFFIGVLLLCFVQTGTIYKEIRRLKSAADHFVLDGDYQAPVCSEGDLSALKDSIHAMQEKVAFRVKALSKDKEYLKDLLSDISHQLKTPLAALRMYNEIIMERKNLSEERKQEFLLLGKQQIDRTDWLVQGLLKMARVEAGAIVMNLRENSLANTVEQATAPFLELASQHKINLRIDVPEEISFCHDRDWTAEAVGNIIKNAIEHTPDGGKVTVSAVQTPLVAELRIADTGRGMEVTEIPHVFERFYSKNKSPDCRNVGIGLSLAKGIIEKNNGSIYVKSSPGIGSEFIVTFLKEKS